MSELISESQNDTYSKSVGTSALVLVLGAGVNHSGSSIASVGWTIELPRVVSVHNSHGSQVLYVGWGSDVSTSNGLPIPAGESRKFRLSYLDEMWAVASGAGTVALVSVAHGKGNPPFSPLELSPTLWLDASDTSTITESAGAVSQWDDKSGNGYDLTQATSADQPTTGTRAINSLNVLDFDGSTDFLSRADEADLRPSSFTAFVVFESDTVSGRHDIVANGKSSGYSTNNWILGHSFAAQSFLGRTPSSVLTAGTFSVSTPVLMRWEHDGATVTGAIDGTSSLNTASTIGTDNTLGTFVGKSSDSSPFDGVVAEVIFVNSALSAQQISDTESYLADKWGITI